MTEQDRAMTKTVNIKVEFTGGLELVFNGRKTLDVALPNAGKTSTVGDLVKQLTKDYLADSPKKDLFVQDGSVRPGILVLVNDADWELEGEAACEIADGDEVVFVSTLHGG